MLLIRAEKGVGLIRLDLCLIALGVFTLTFSLFNIVIFAFSSVLVFVAYGLMCRDIGGLCINKKGTITFFGLLSFSFVVSILGDFYVNNFIKTSMNALVMVVLAGYFSGRNSKAEFLFVIRFVILAHSMFFLVQFFVFMLTGEYVDFNSYVRGEEAVGLYESKALEGLAVQIRAGGLFSEPSFYSMSILPFTLVLMVLERNVGKIAAVGLGTSLLSLSIASMIVVAISCAVYAVAVGLSKREKILLIAGIVFSFPFMYTVYDLRVNQSIDYDAVGSRNLIFLELRLRDLRDSLFGSGFFWNENYPQGKLNLDGAHIRDSSFYAYMLYGAGYIGSAFFIFLVTKLFGYKSVFFYLFLCMLLFKHHFVSAMLWLVILIMYIAESYRCKENN